MSWVTAFDHGVAVLRCRATSGCAVLRCRRVQLPDVLCCGAEQYEWPIHVPEACSELWSEPA